MGADKMGINLEGGGALRIGVNPEMEAKLGALEVQARMLGQAIIESPVTQGTVYVLGKIREVGGGLLAKTKMGRVIPLIAALSPAVMAFRGGMNELATNRLKAELAVGTKMNNSLMVEASQNGNDDAQNLGGEYGPVMAMVTGSNGVDTMFYGDSQDYPDYKVEAYDSKPFTINPDTYLYTSPTGTTLLVEKNTVRFFNMRKGEGAVTGPANPGLLLVENGLSPSPALETVEVMPNGDLRVAMDSTNLEFQEYLKDLFMPHGERYSVASLNALKELKGGKLTFDISSARPDGTMTIKVWGTSPDGREIVVIDRVLTNQPIIDQSGGKTAMLASTIDVKGKLSFVALPSIDSEVLIKMGIDGSKLISWQDDQGKWYAGLHDGDKKLNLGPDGIWNEGAGVELGTGWSTKEADWPKLDVSVTPDQINAEALAMIEKMKVDTSKMIPVEALRTSTANGHFRLEPVQLGPNGETVFLEVNSIDEMPYGPTFSALTPNYFQTKYPELLDKPKYPFPNEAARFVVPIWTAANEWLFVPFVTTGDIINPEAAFSHDWNQSLFFTHEPVAVPNLPDSRASSRVPIILWGGDTPKNVVYGDGAGWSNAPYIIMANELEAKAIVAKLDKMTLRTHEDVQATQELLDQLEWLSVAQSVTFKK